MGIIMGDWHFPSGGAPSLQMVADALEEMTGLEVKVTDNGKRLRIVPLHLEVFEPHIEERLLSVRGFPPPHPYLWENLDRVLSGFGGICDTDDDSLWHPDPVDAALRTRWVDLSPRDRRLLGLPPFGVATRWFDRSLSWRRIAR